MSFVVIRHPEAGVGTAPVEALPLYEANGWQVVSDERPDPGMFHLPDYADAVPALTARTPLAAAGFTAASVMAAVQAQDLTLLAPQPDNSDETEEQS